LQFPRVRPRYLDAVPDEGEEHTRQLLLVPTGKPVRGVEQPARLTVIGRDRGLSFLFVALIAHGGWDRHTRLWPAVVGSLALQLEFDHHLPHQ
jgi:hypothetical protein